MLLVLLIVLIVLAFGGIPTWGYHSYGYWPSGVALILVVLLAVFLLSGRL